MVRQAVREPDPLVRVVRRRTVANIDSIGFEGGLLSQLTARLVERAPIPEEPASPTLLPLPSERSSRLLSSPPPALRNLLCPSRAREHPPLRLGARAFFDREVRRHVPDGWIDTKKRDPRDGRVGVVG